MSDYNRTFNGEAKIKLTQIVNEGMHVLHEIDTLNGGLNDTIKAVAEELEIKASTLKKAIKRYGPLSVYRKLDAVAKLSLRTAPDASNIFSRDRDWIRSNFELKE